ncbi:hypothetical protein N5I08_15625 [Acinetobacter johnsonii]|uniref:hypothetical protein n=1 Tax=Acinetobacter johnsonii TaxID=40214 RepID=UPI00244927C3|nr:hypothetical protein [Acinetobacter johnsonii]MDH1520420.1 hypothetical protein [Acinetobacter johnsonii]
MSEANPFVLIVLILLLPAFKSLPGLSQKLPQRIERKRDSIEFERSENQGQFFLPWAFNYFKVFKCF